MTVDISKVFPMAGPEIRLYRLPKMKEILSASGPTIHRMVIRGELPPPIRISERVSAWRSDQVEEYIKSRMAVSYGANPVKATQEQPAAASGQARRRGGLPKTAPAGI